MDIEQIEDIQNDAEEIGVVCSADEISELCDLAYWGVQADEREQAIAAALWQAGYVLLDVTTDDDAEPVFQLERVDV